MSIWWKKGIVANKESSGNAKNFFEIISLKINKLIIVKTDSNLHIIANHLAFLAFDETFPT